MWFFKKKKQSSNTSLETNRDLVSVRMEAIGGQGANSAGKILAEAAVLGLGYTGNHFSSFGSEKRGSPIKSYVRFSPALKPIRTASSIQQPDILIIFHESLMQTHPEIFEGVGENCDVLINTAKAPQDVVFPQGIAFGSVATVNATKISNSHGCGINAVMLGGLTVFCPEIGKDPLMAALENYFSHLSDKVKNSNLSGFKAAISAVKNREFSKDQAIGESQDVSLPDLGWLNAPLGGVIVNPGNSVLKDHSTSRKGVAPQFNKELCFNCGYCDMVCPDFCFVWELKADGGPELKGIDYQYCKGCQKCVVVCPVDAIKPVAEGDLGQDLTAQKVFPEVSGASIEKRWKNLDWAKYVEELSVEDKMMTLQTELLNHDSYLRPDFSKEIVSRAKLKK